MVARIENFYDLTGRPGTTWVPRALSAHKDHRGTTDPAIQDRRRRLAVWARGLRDRRAWGPGDLEEFQVLRPTPEELASLPDYLSYLGSSPAAKHDGGDTPGRIRGGDEGVKLLTWDDESRLAAAASEDWLIKDRLEFGALSLLAAAPKAGKSTLIMHLLSAIAKGTDLLGLEVARVPVLYLDVENRPRFRVDKYRSAAQFEEGEIAEYYRRPRTIPSPLTVDYVERAIRAAAEDTGRDRGLVVIDTLRSAFLGADGFSERDPAYMAGLLGRLRKAAERTRWALLLLHHTTKQKSTYYGSVAIAGAVDYLWTLSANEKTRITTLSVRGRGDSVEDMSLSFCRATQRLELLESGGDTGDAEEESDLLDYFDQDERGAITAGEFQRILEQSGSPNHSKSFAESRIRKGYGEGLLQRSGSGTKSSPFRYWLSDAGRLAADGGNAPGEGDGESEVE